MTNVIMISFLLIASFFDVREKKIPNKLIVLGLICLIVNEYKFSGLNSISHKIICFLLILAVLFPLFYLKMFGAGDLKMFALVGSFVGLFSALEIFLYSFVLGSLLSVAIMKKKGILIARITNFLNYISYGIKNREPYYVRERDGEEIIIPFAPFVLAGYLIWLFVVFLWK